MQAGRQLLCRSRCVPVRLLSTWRPSTNLVSTQNHHLLSSSNVIQQSASFLHASDVTSSNHIVTIQDDKDFETRVLHSQKPVIVDFFATYVIFFHVTLVEVQFVGVQAVAVFYLVSPFIYDEKVHYVSEK